MKRHTITFHRLESDFDKIGKIRSVTVDHERRMLILISDEIEAKENEGATIPGGINFSTGEDY